MAVGARQVDRVLLALVGEETAAARADEIDRLGAMPAAVAGERTEYVLTATGIELKNS